MVIAMEKGDGGLSALPVEGQSTISSSSDPESLSAVIQQGPVMRRSFVVPYVASALVTATPLRSMSAWNPAANDASRAPAWDNFAIPF